MLATVVWSCSLRLLGQRGLELGSWCEEQGANSEQQGLRHVELRRVVRDALAKHSAARVWGWLLRALDVRGLVRSASARWQAGPGVCRGRLDGSADGRPGARRRVIRLRRDSLHAGRGGCQGTVSCGANDQYVRILDERHRSGRMPCPVWVAICGRAVRSPTSPATAAAAAVWDASLCSCASKQL